MNTTALAFKFFIVCLVAAYEKTAAALITWADPPEPDWTWVGKGDLLFSRILEEGGFVYKGHLKPDRETCAKHFGSLGTLTTKRRSRFRACYNLYLWTSGEPESIEDGSAFRLNVSKPRVSSRVRLDQTDAYYKNMLRLLTFPKSSRLSDLGFFLE